MKRYLLTTLLALGLVSGAACAAEAKDSAPLQVASLGKSYMISGLKSDLYDKKALHNAVADSLRLLTWDDREVKRMLKDKKVQQPAAKLGGKD